MKKICIFTGFYIPHLGGVERYTEKLVEMLLRLGNDVTIITSNDNDYLEYEEKENYKIYRLPVFDIFKNRYPIFKYNKTLREILKKIDECDFDAYICQTHIYLISQKGAKIAFKHNKRPIVIEHGSGHFTVNNCFFDYLGRIYEHYLTKRLKKYYPKFYGVSESCNDWLKHFDIYANGVLYNSVSKDVYNKFKDTKYIKNKQKDKIYVAYIGRIIEEKGVQLLLKAVKELNNDFKNIELYIAGDGPLLNKYKQEYSEVNIHFEGKISHDDVMKLCNQIDIFVYPSMYPEGLPTGILEAGLMKCAVIATDRGGTKEVINDNKYGIIMEENLESLKSNLRYLLEHPKEILNMKNNLQKRILSNFTWNTTANKLLSEIEK